MSEGVIFHKNNDRKIYMSIIFFFKLLFTIFSMIYAKNVKLESHNNFTLLSSSSCVCTTVDCPKTGENNIIMGNGYANMNYIYEQHGNYIVVTYASGILLPQSLDQGTETTSCTQKYSRMLEDDGNDNCDAGHILANRLGGYGNIPINIFPQNPAINRGSYAQFEGFIYDCIQNGAEKSILNWKFYYENEKTMPYKVLYDADFIGGTCKNTSSEFSN